jgi:succinate-semialdehyde dehydrogenase/glutarate-semialdehyde dehydrogenase
MSNFEYPDPKLFIAGQWRDSENGKGMPVYNPATGDVIAQVPVATKADLDEALDAANKGFEIWRKKTAVERAQVLRKAGDLLRERAEYIGTVIRDLVASGKRLDEAREELQYHKLQRREGLE